MTAQLSRIHAARVAQVAAAQQAISDALAAEQAKLAEAAQAAAAQAQREQTALDVAAADLADEIDQQLATELRDQLVPLFRLYVREPSRAALEKLRDVLLDADAKATELLGAPSGQLTWPLATAFIAALGTPAALAKFSAADAYTNGPLDAAGDLRRAAMAGSIVEAETAARELETRVAARLRGFSAEPTADQQAAFAVLASGIRSSERQARLQRVHADQAEHARKRFEDEYAAELAASA